MRTLGFLLKKEFRQIFRNKALLPLIFAMPIIQLLIMPLAADYEIKNINVAIVDRDHSSLSRDLVNSVLSSGYFQLVEYGKSYPNAFKLIESDDVDLILEIPENFEKDLLRNGKEDVFLAVNAINGTKANLGGAYLGRIIQEFNQTVRLKWSSPQLLAMTSRIEITQSNWYNPTFNYSYFMVPGILVILVTMVGAYMCSLNIVKEKEIGTIEQINVTPIKKYHFILGKMIPFWIIGLFMFSMGLFLVGRLVYGIVPQGNLFLLYGYVSLYLIALLGFGLLISTYAETQQQAMSVVFFFMMIFILMSGLFTSIDSMPAWSQVIARLNPVTYFIDVIRLNILKGSGLKDITNHIFIMIGFAIFFNTWAIINYRKTS